MDNGRGRTDRAVERVVVVAASQSRELIALVGQVLPEWDAREGTVRVQPVHEFDRLHVRIVESCVGSPAAAHALLAGGTHGMGDRYHPPGLRDDSQQGI